MQRGLIAIALTAGIHVAHGEGRGAYLRDKLPATWIDEAGFSQTLPSDDSWWKNFHDPLLDSLISQGEANNFNVLMAAKRMEIARQTLNGTKAAYLPRIDFSGGWTKSRSSGAMTSSGTSASTVSYFNLGLDMSWQIDLFGKITAQARRSKALWQASRAEYAGAMVSLCGSIATTYFQLRMYQGLKSMAERHIASQGEVVKITQARYETGLASKLDVAQAMTVYSSTQATLPPIETSIQSSINALAVLLGVTPDKVSARLLENGAIPEYRMIVDAGVPMQLLRRRPDIVASERELAAYAAALGVAKKDFLPTLSLNGSIGTAAHDGKDLFAGNSLTYTIAPTLTWTVFDGFARKYAVAEARENMQLGIDSYNMAVVTAVQEVENAMVAYRQALEHIDRLNEVMEHAGESYRLSLDLYKGGLAGFYNVVNSQMNMLQYANGLISAKGDALVSLVRLYEALGGGWGEYLDDK